MASLVLTVLGPDRPGLVDQLSGLVSEHGGNWERSQMARLGGKFAGIVQVSVPDAAVAALRAALAELNAEGPLGITVELAGSEPAAGGQRVTVSLVGTDRPGLIHSVSAALAAVGANIEDLSTATTNAPMSGGPLFEATVVVSLPSGVEVAQVRNQLEALADRLMVDLEVT